ncbi:MAG: hypothetical protein HC889_01005 [Synechococcaceae cyanobacterium SM1_2_3]|nr:hypothetical protein [Synechococcaceae cyanobacterium SM1_2_3]
MSAEKTTAVCSAASLPLNAVIVLACTNASPMPKNKVLIFNYKTTMTLPSPERFTPD